jgi:peptidoglycan/xylan/chitin deacetylase (PgdA/CDA1 family)
VLSINSKRQLFRPQKPKKIIILGITTLVVLSFSTGIIYYFNSNSYKTAANTVIENVNTASNKVEPVETKVEQVDNKVEPVENMDKPQGTETPNNVGAGKNDTDAGSTLPEEKPLKDYEVKVEELFKKDGVKNAYLTFDDGPTKKITPQVLDILKSYNIKASFFVMGDMVDKSPELLKRAYEDGHAICIHSYSHDYKKLYNSQDFFKADLELSVNTLKKYLGEDFSTRVYRFPGGSSGKDKEIYRQLLKDAGYHSLDWNALNGDAETIKKNGEKTTRNAEELVARLKESIIQTGNPEDIVVLMHDASSKQATADSLPEVIEYLKSQGFNFKTIK